MESSAHAPAIRSGSRRSLLFCSAAGTRWRFLRAPSGGRPLPAHPSGPARSSGGREMSAATRAASTALSARDRTRTQGHQPQRCAPGGASEELICPHCRGEKLHLRDSPNKQSKQCSESKRYPFEKRNYRQLFNIP